MKTKELSLFYHKYKFFPYEKRFAIREIESLFKPSRIIESSNSVSITGFKNERAVEKLVYFSHGEYEQSTVKTLQFFFESGGKSPKSKRQNTRYSVHGLHEYKGKFNPQIVRALFNIYGVDANHKVLDPFCGSGTTLVEAAHQKISACGTDINPLAAFIANAKVQALGVSTLTLTQCKGNLGEIFKSISKKIRLNTEEPRTEYLLKWFPKDTLIQMEAFRLAAEGLPKEIKDIFLVIISNNLRDYSFQEPSDLRIRRRSTPLPEIPFVEKVLQSIDVFLENLGYFQHSVKTLSSRNKAYNVDIKHAGKQKDFKASSFDFAITSPPYATALPYIDTQRLSLVWLGLIPPDKIKALESMLIGSREFNLKKEHDLWHKKMIENTECLPDNIHDLCVSLNKKLKPNEGFRKRALPALLYRYFSEMKDCFIQVKRLLKKDKYFCLVVGHNHTTIGGKRTDIDTPKLLSTIGVTVGFELFEIVPMEAYQRYGLHSLNAVQKESLIVFKK